MQSAFNKENRVPHNCLLRIKTQRGEETKKATLKKCSLFIMLHTLSNSNL